jgi:CheY-like chemotaxis protein
MDQSKNLSIFLADDDEDDCVLFQDALTEVVTGMDLVISSDGEELMNMLDERVPPEPRVIFLDLNMPRKNGLECLQEIRRSEKLKNIPVVVLSTSSQQDSIDQAFVNGANRYITKPGTYGLLKKLIQKVLLIDWSQATKPAPENFILQP